MKRIMVIALCGMLMAGCGSAGTAASPASASSAAAGSAASSEEGSAASSEEGSAEDSKAAPEETKSAGKTVKEDFEEQEYCGIHYLADPVWEIEVTENEELCRIQTPNENVFFAFGRFGKDAIVNDDTDDGIYRSLEVFVGENDQDLQRLKFENGTPYITYFSDFKTDHGYNSAFYTKEGLFAFSLQVIGEIDEAEESEYVEDYHMMLETMDFEKAEYQSMK